MVTEAQTDAGRLQFDAFDAWDFGADTNSMEFARETIGVARPLGLNLEDSRIANMRSAGMVAECHDVLTIPNEARTDYILMCHFLEHLPDDAACEQAIALALCAARKGLYISGPYFDDDDLARRQGLKFFWGNWIDHTSRFSVARLLTILDRLGVRQYTVSLGFPVTSWNDEGLLHIDERMNVGKHDRTCMPKRRIKLLRPLYQEFALSIAQHPDVETRSWHVARHGLAGVAQYELVREYSRQPDRQIAETMRVFMR